MSRWRYWLGRWRMRYGFCPKCYSSPPLSSCSICSGERLYGPHIRPATLKTWRLLWEAQR